MPKSNRKKAFFACLSALLIAPACTAAPPPPTAAPRATLAATATPTPAPSATATPEPSPTPDLAAIQAQARRARFDGDIQRAATLYAQAETLLPAAGDEQSETRFQRARLQFETDDVAGAITSLRALISDTRAVSAAHPALGAYYTLLGRASEGVNPAEAAALYQNAIDGGSVISPYLNLWLGNYFLALNVPISAVVPYQRAVDGAPGVSIEFERREKLAAAHSRSGNFAAAQAQYAEILTRARVPNYRARILWESAQALLADGQSRAAYDRFDDLITNYERTPQALLALQALLEARQPVDEIQRGRVNFYAKSYPAARDAFRRAIQTNGARLDDVRIWAARNYAAMDLPNDAIRNLDQIIASNAPGSAKAAEALIVKSRVLLNVNNARGALALLPEIKRGGATAAGLFELALAFERDGDTNTAAELYALGNTLPDPALPTLTRARAATILSQLNRHTDAERELLKLLAQPGVDPSASSRLRFYLSKAQIASGRIVTGETTLRALAADLPDTYEGVRAAQIVNGERMRATARPLTLPADDDGQAEAEAWLRSWNGISDTVDVRALRQDVAVDARLRRGLELWRIGFEPEALDEFAGLINAYAQDPIALYQIALRFRDLGAYRMSIRAADTLMRRSSAGDSPSKLPVFIARLIYPAYYGDLVQSAAAEFNVDPLLVFSIIRQESLFEAFAESSAAASGLMQVIPTTGAEINRELNWPPNYDTRDLSKPFVSVRYGAYYLGKQKRLFEANVPAMLAAYNGGPGNALRWRERAGDDPDAFVESVTFDETRRYIVAITVNVAIYQRLYGGIN